MTAIRNTIPEYPIQLLRGVTRRMSIGLRSRGAVVPLAGYTAKLQARESAKATAVLVELTVENGGIEIDAAGGIVTLVFSAAATAAWSLPGEYDLMLKSPSGEVSCVLRGTVTPEQAITRWN